MTGCWWTLGRLLAPSGRESLLAFQSRQLRRLIHHAYDRVPYYRRRLDQHGVSPGDVRSREDLAALPVTSKRDLQPLSESEVVARGVGLERLVVHKTSGSTGEPVVVRRTRIEEALLSAFRLRAIQSLGYRPTDRVARVALVWSAADDASFARALLARLRLFRIEEIHSLLPPGEIIRALRRVRPNVLTGFAGPVARVAHALAGQDRGGIRPRAVIVGGEVLTPPMRRQIAEAFGAPVREWYGSREFNLLAWECPETGLLHVGDDCTVVEVVRDGRPVAPGERGEVVATGLHSFAMPFIRYRLGDLATRGPDPCPCGAPFSTIRGVQGRMHDWFVLPDARLVHPYELILELREHFSWISQYQLIQERVDRVTLRLGASEPPAGSTLARRRERVGARLGEGVTLGIELVPAIDLDASGKSRVACSLVRSEYDAVDWSRV